MGVHFLASSFALSSFILDRSLQIYTRVLPSVFFLKSHSPILYIPPPCLQIVFQEYILVIVVIIVIIIIKLNQLSGLSELTDFYC